jgi:hypothetical protein
VVGNRQRIQTTSTQHRPTAFLSHPRHAAIFDSLSAFAQDSWRAHRRLTLTYGFDGNTFRRGEHLTVQIQ